MRVSKTTDIGIDPGKEGAIVVTQEGRVIEYFLFAKYISTIGQNQLIGVDPIVLQRELDRLRKYADTLTLETPKITTYSGWENKKGTSKITVSSICKLQAQVAQIYHAAIVAGFQVNCADPQNWQGYHNLSACAKKEVKEVLLDTFIEWHQENDPLNPVLSLKRSSLSGIADAWAIAQYRYQQPPKGKEKRSNRVKIVQPEMPADFIMF